MLAHMAQGGDHRAHRRTPTAAEVAAVEWWLDAGHDALVLDEPNGWLKVPEREQPVERATPASPAARLVAIPTLPDEDFESLDSLDALRALVGRIPLGDGAPESGVMLLGEANSADDLRTLRPFSGPAGDLLDRMLASIGLDRTRCYISNLCPRRPMPGAPSPGDIARDLPLTRAHIRLVKPRLLLLLGGTPAQALFADKTPIGKLRGQWRDLQVNGHMVATLPTFNPAYLLRRPAEKRLAWADLRQFKARL